MHLNGSKKIDVSIVKDAKDLDEVIHYIVNNELNELKYKPIKDWFSYLDNIVKIGYPSSADIGRLAELKASRDILIHNGGAINEIYIRKAGPFARHRNGECIVIDVSYLNESWELVREVVIGIGKALKEKLTPHSESAEV